MIKKIFQKITFSLESKIIYFIIMMLLIFALILVRTTYQRDQDFRRYHLSIAEISTQKISHEIEKVFLNKKRLVDSFYEDNIQLIEDIIKNPDNRDAYEVLNFKLKRYFNDYFATNILNADGTLLIDEFDGHIGNLCLQDVHEYIHNGIQSIRIHPNYNMYHYDILLNIKIKNKKYLFFVSFNANEIVNMLNISQNHDHKLMIINSTIHNLIEITAQGTREKLTQHDAMYLTQEEQENIISLQNIKGTKWNIVDIIDSNLFHNYKKSVIYEELKIFILFMLLTLVMAAIIISSLREKERLSLTITKLNTKLKKLALKDGLTSIYNRRYFDTTSKLKYREAKRLGLTFNLAIIDIDFFKSYNDNYGHVKGDECLRVVAQCIQNNFQRSHEFCARYGGEEFAIVSIGENEKEFSQRLISLHDALQNKAIVHEFSSVSPFVSISIGYCSSRDLKDISLEKFITNADRALYKVKDNGRNSLSSSY